MFYYERYAASIDVVAELRKRSDAEIDAALWAFVDAYLLIADHVLRDADAYPQTKSIDGLMDALRARTVPPIPVLNRLVGYVLNELTIWRPKFRPLTDHERRILAVAWQFSDAIHGPRDTQ